MKCEWAEGYLSAYLDNTLDPSLRAEVSEHLASCERCSAILADYRRYDALLANSVRLTPPDSLRNRIFSSPEFAAILQSSTRQAERATSQPAQPSKPSLGPRWRAPATPFSLSSMTPTTPDEASASSTEASPPNADTPTTDAPARAPSAAPTPIRPARRPPLAKLLLPVAAALILALGVSAIVSQGFGAFGVTRSPGQSTDVRGAPNFSTAPLDAGSRLVFAHDGALWSAPEAGVTGAPGGIQRLTSPSVNVIVWSVSPIANGHGGAWIAYVDGNTGALHLVRSDRQGDQIIDAVAQAPAKGHSIPAAFWTKGFGAALRAQLSWSPSGQRLAYMVAAPDGASITLTVATFTAPADPARPLGVTRQSGLARVGGFTTNLTWSADGEWLGFVQQPTPLTTQFSQSVWLYDARANQATRLTAQADPQNAESLIVQLAVAPHGGAATWNTGDGAVTTGIFTQSVTAPTPTRLTPEGVNIGATALSVNGEWLVWDGGSLATVSAFASAGSVNANPRTVATLATRAQSIRWSPTGAVAAIVTQDAVSLWSPTTGLVLVTKGNSLARSLEWSADGQQLAFTEGAQVTSARIRDGRVTALTALGHSDLPIKLLWSPDGRTLAVASTHSTTLRTNDGAHTMLVAPYQADYDGVEYVGLAWSIAG